MASGADARSLCDVLNTALNTDLTPADFVNPNPDRVQGLFRSFIVHAFEVPESSLTHLPLECLSESDESEAIIRSAPLIILHQTMTSVISDLDGGQGVEFSMCDLISPEPRKFRIFAQLIAEYVKFYKVMAPVWESTCAFYEGQRGQLEEFQLSVEEAEKRREQVSADSDSRKRRENGLRAELCPKEIELKDLLAKVNFMEGQLDECKRRVDQEKFEKNELVVEKDTQEMQLEQLSLQLVGSPDRVLKELDQYKEELRISREDCDKHRKTNEEIKAQLALAPTIEQQIDRFNGDVQAVLVKEQTNLNSKEMEKVEMDRMLREAERKLKSTTKKIKDAEYEGEEEEQNHKRDEEMHKSRMEELAEQKRALEQEILELKKGGAAQPAAERQLQSEISVIRSQKIEKIAAIRHEMETLTENYRAYMNCYENKKQALLDDMANWNKVATRVSQESKSREAFGDLDGTWNGNMSMSMSNFNF